MSDEQDRIKAQWRSVRRAALVVVAVIVGGYIGFWFAVFWAIPTPSYVLGGAHRMLFAAFVLTPVAAAASGSLAFLLNKVKQRTIRFTLWGAVLAAALAAIAETIAMSKMSDPASRVSPEHVWTIVRIGLAASALIGMLGGLAISRLTAR